ncbi:hypothetical protein CALCODRAFT_244435 [Calocera cornea HHB12733]|uniref:Uncharacterized protein n=1 Tax=Calocera cornea HHB12733 TaxID=1353952 RepID=A0A165AMU1_9BASI|nr:hypothetical protein CALCODRAFT_244435 [Calocera cornea HHB12733]
MRELFWLRDDQGGWQTQCNFFWQLGLYERNPRLVDTFVTRRFQHRHPVTVLCRPLLPQLSCVLWSPIVRILPLESSRSSAALVATPGGPGWPHRMTSISVLPLHGGGHVLGLEAHEVASPNNDRFLSSQGRATWLARDRWERILNITVGRPVSSVERRRAHCAPSPFTLARHLGLLPVERTVETAATECALRPEPADVEQEIRAISALNPTGTILWAQFCAHFGCQYVEALVKVDTVRESRYWEALILLLPHICHDPYFLQRAQWRPEDIRVVCNRLALHVRKLLAAVQEATEARADLKHPEAELKEASRLAEALSWLICAAWSGGHVPVFLDRGLRETLALAATRTAERSRLYQTHFVLVELAGVLGGERLKRCDMDAIVWAQKLWRCNYKSCTKRDRLLPCHRYAWGQVPLLLLARPTPELSRDHVFRSCYTDAVQRPM